MIFLHSARWVPLLTATALIAGYFLTRQKTARGTHWAALWFTISWAVGGFTAAGFVFLQYASGTAMSAGTGSSPLPYYWIFSTSFVPLVLAVSGWFAFPRVHQEQAQRAFRIIFYVVLPAAVAIRLIRSSLGAGELDIDLVPFFAAL